MEDRDAIREYRRTRDPELFRLLVERHQRRVFHAALAVFGPGGDAEAEEIAQECFLAAFRQLDQFRGDAAFGSWLYRIAYRLAVERRKRARHRLPHLGEDALARLRAGGDIPAELVAADEHARIREAVDQLPDLYRALVLQYYWLERPLEEISETLGVPVGTLKSYLARAREQIRRRLPWKKS